MSLKTPRPNSLDRDVPEILLRGFGVLNACSPCKVTPLLYTE